jgi:hypothetical protein
VADFAPGSTAGVQADAGTWSTAWWMASVMVIATEYYSLSTVRQFPTIFMICVT